MRTFKKFDILGQQIGFEENDSTKFRTWQGATLTFIVIAVCSVIGFLFGQEVYERKQANVRYSKNLIETSTIEVNKNPFLLVIADKYGNIVENPLDYVTVNFDVYSFDENLKVTFKRKSLEENCTHKSLSSYNSIFIPTPCTNNLGCFCPNLNENFNFTNTYTNANSQFLHFNIFPCNKNKRKCADDMDSFLSNFFMTALVLNSYVASDDYEDPIKYYLDTRSFQISRAFY